MLTLQTEHPTTDLQSVNDVMGARANSTSKSYGFRLADFNRFRHKDPNNVLDVSDETIRDYLNDLSRRINPRTKRLLAFDTIKAHASAIRSDLEAFGKKDLFGDKSKATMKRIRRECANGNRIANKQVEGLTWDQVDRIVEVLESDETKVALRDSAMIQLMSDGLLRVGEAVSVNVEHLRLGDGPGTLFIPNSKTDQDGRGEVVYVSAKVVQAVRRWMFAVGIEEGPLFCRFRKGDKPVPGQRITVNAARGIIKKAAKQAGIEGRVSGHSLRIGSTVDLVRHGAQTPEIEQAGRWKNGSKMVQTYARHEFAGRNAIARYRDGQAAIAECVD